MFNHQTILRAGDSAVRRRRCRPFTILDAMILVGATAVGLGPARAMFLEYTKAPPAPFAFLFLAHKPITFLLLTWTLAILLLRLRRPRPAMRRLVCQPGMAACCAVAVVVLIDAISWGIYWTQLVYLARREPDPAMRMLSRFWGGSFEHIGQAVAAVWLGLVLSRCWRPEAGWIDRFGRLIGTLWLISLFATGHYGRWTYNLIERLWGKG